MKDLHGRSFFRRATMKTEVHSMKLPDDQLQAARYYEGDVDGDDSFWGDPKAYVTLNSLFYEGIGTERRRAAEGKMLNPALLDDPERLYQICRSLLNACRAADLHQERKTYRVERYADYLEMEKASAILSFTSTSAGGFLREYGDRSGIALMEFIIPPGIPCLPYAEVLDEDYLKTEEHEILLPPGLSADFTRLSLSGDDLEIYDAEGNPPLIKCRAVLTGIIKTPLSAPPVPEGTEAGKRVYDALMNETEPDPEDVALYTAWKRYFRARVLSSFFY